MSENHSRLFATVHELYSPWKSPDQNTGVGSLSLLQGIFPNPEIEPRSPALQADSLPTELPGKPLESGASRDYMGTAAPLGIYWGLWRDLWKLS